jgi:HNH endonuclease
MTANGTSEIKLTKGKKAKVDSHMLWLLEPYKWKAVQNKDRWYAIAYKRKNKVLTIIWMHRLLLGIQGEDYKTKMADHINHDCLDNRLENLRLATNQQNQRNARAHKDAKLGVKGVYWRESRKRFEVRAFLNGKRIYLGFAKTLEKAIEIYNSKIKEVYGEYAYINK